MKKLMNVAALAVMGASVMGANLAVMAKSAPAKTTKSTTPTKVVMVCPVLGSKIASPKDAAGYSDVKGVRYYFCCGGCKPQFDANPAKFIAKLPKGAVQNAPKHG